MMFYNSERANPGEANKFQRQREGPAKGEIIWVAVRVEKVVDVPGEDKYHALTCSLTCTRGGHD